ncbi:hypothetical protein [Microvirga zambiensis]|uniref:hypothetical protein n=1 Tax=Microvirga zambiensis TaxID=1402137 RepID=UPI0031B582DF
MLLLKAGEEFQLLLQVRQQPLAGFDGIVRCGEKLLEEIESPVGWRLVESPAGAHLSSQFITLVP